MKHTQEQISTGEYDLGELLEDMTDSIASALMGGEVMAADASDDGYIHVMFANEAECIIRVWHA